MGEGEWQRKPVAAAGLTRQACEDSSAARPAFHARGTSNSNLRGNTHDRRKRREWMLKKFGNGKTCPCHWCGKTLRKPQADRYPRCGHMGGRYTRDNIVPSCPQCNAVRCGPGGSKCQVWRETHGAGADERGPL